jgi:Cu/Ag efflux protein CusF
MFRQSKWLPLSLALALLVLFASPALAVKVKSVAADQHQITVTDQNNKDFTYTLVDGAKIFLSNGKEGKLGDLKAGENVSLLWEKRGDKYFANAIMQQEGELKDAILTEGTVKRVNADQHEVIVTDSNNKDWTYHLNDKGQVSVGTKTGKLSDLKDGDKIILVYEKKGDRLMVRDICTSRR